MRQRFKIMTVGLALVLASVSGTFWAQAQSRTNKRAPELADFMRIKLNHAQEVLRGITLEDYQRVATNAKKMSLHSLESNWQVMQTKPYLDMSAEFRASANRLAQAAKERNQDGTTLAYFEMTMKCVRCHRYLRKVEQVARSK